MNLIIHRFISIVCLVSWTYCSPIKVIPVTNMEMSYFLPNSFRQSLRIPRSQQSNLQLTDEHNGNDAGGPITETGFEPSNGQLSISQQDYHQHEKFDDGYDESNHYGQKSHENSHGHDFHIDSHVHSIPIAEHVEVTKPVAVPVYKEIGVPVPHPVKINVPHPVAVGVPQPYPVAVPVQHPVPIQIIRTVAVPVEKKVPYPVEKHIPVAIEKPVPITIERHIPVPVEKPYPIKIPVYKTIYHRAKSYGHYYHH